MLVTASWFEGFKQDLGIEGVSQIWAERPAWYFWICGAPGAYQFQLEDAAEAAGGGVQGMFSIKCYPYTHTAAYRGLSAEERDLLESDLFDHTGTPAAEARERISENLFNVAVFECRLGSDGQLSQLALESLDRMVVRRLSTDMDAGGVNPSVDMRRSVPAWELAYPLFDRLVCLWIHYRRQKPSDVRLMRATGFETLLQSDQPPLYRDTQAASVYTLQLGFAAQGPFSTMPPGGQRGTQDPGSVIFDHRSTCGHFHPPIGPVPLIGSLNPAWWSLADAHFRCDLASTCGCDHDH